MSMQWTQNTVHPSRQLLPNPHVGWSNFAIFANPIAANTLAQDDESSDDEQWMMRLQPTALLEQWILSLSRPTEALQNGLRHRRAQHLANDADQRSKISLTARCNAREAAIQMTMNVSSVAKTANYSAGSMVCLVWCQSVCVFTVMGVQIRFTPSAWT